MASEKIFVNSAWTKNVPAKSPQGTPLKAGDNAFASLEAALSKYPDDLGDKQVILLDKSSTVNNTIKGTDVDFTYLASQEIDKDAAKNATTATSAVNAVGNLSLTYEPGTGPDEATLGGFLNVNVTTKGDETGTTELTVLGGKNAVAHAYVANDVAEKGAVTVKSIATGTLNVTNSKVAFAGGAFAEVIGTDGFDITADDPFFCAAGTGDPAAFEDFTPGNSTLSMLSGYSTVSLQKGSEATFLVGGNQTYSVTSSASEKQNSAAVNKVYAYSAAASGSLTVDNSIVGEADGYATVTITGSNSGFGMINAYTQNDAEKSAYAANSVSQTTTDVISVKETAAGKATISKVSNGGSVWGYNNVTISDSTVQELEAGSFKNDISTTNANAEKANITTTSNSFAQATAYAAYGTLASKKSEIAWASGFNNVSLDEVTVNGEISAAVDSYYSGLLNADGFAGSSKTVTKSTTVEGDATSTTSESTTTEAAAATGTLTMKKSSTAEDVSGFATVTASATQFGGGIAAGKKNLTRAFFSKTVNDNTTVTTQEKVAADSISTGTLKLSGDNSSVGGDVRGFASVTAADTEFGGNIAGGKGAISENVAYSKTVKKDDTIEVESYVADKTKSASGKLALDDSTLADGAVITGYQAVSLKDVEGNVALIDSENLKQAQNDKNTFLNDELTGRTVKKTVVKSANSTFTLTNGDDDDFAVDKISGFNKVTADYGTFGQIMRIDKPETNDPAAEETFPTDKEEFALNYAKTEKKTTLKASGNTNFTTNGSVTLSKKAAAGEIDGFSSVTLTGTADAPVQAGAINGISWNDSITLATEKDADGEFTSSSYIHTEKDTASLAFKATKATTGVVEGFKSAVIDQSIVEGLIAGNARVSKETLTTSRKGDVYNEVRSETTSDKAYGVVTVTGTKDITAVVGGIYGASKVVATKSILGPMLNSSNCEMSEKLQFNGENIIAIDSGLVDGIVDLNEVTPVEDEVSLAEEDLTYAQVVVDDTTTKYSWTSVWTDTAKATAVLSDTMVEGGIQGYGAVTLDNSAVFGSVIAGVQRTEEKTDYDKGVYTRTTTETKNLIGSLTAKNNSLIAGPIKGFNAVTLTNAEVSGDVLGGKVTDVTKAKGNGATISDAAGAAEVVEEEKVNALGALKATDATILGRVESFKAVTFSGDNEVHGIYGVSSDKDSVTIAAKSALTLAADQDTGKTVLGHVDKDNEEYQALETVAVNGTLRLAVASIDDLEINVNKIAGSGMIAIQEDDYDAIHDMVVAKVGSKFNIVNGGNEDAIKTIRTQVEELSDNAQAKATAVKSETEVNGWLSGMDQNDMFKDTEDWFAFSKENGSWTSNTYEVEFINNTDIQAELYSGSTKIDESVWKEDLGTGFALKTANLGNYSSVQLKLFVDNDVDPVAYKVSVASAPLV